MSNVDSYKRQMEAITERWAARVQAIMPRVRDLQDRIAQISAKQSPTLEEVQARKALEEDLRNARLEVERFSLEYRLESLAVAPPRDSPRKELVPLPAWLRDLIRNKGLRLGGGIVITPEIKFDLKHFVPNYIGVKIRW